MRSTHHHPRNVWIAAIISLVFGSGCRSPFELPAPPPLPPRAKEYNNPTGTLSSERASEVLLVAEEERRRLARVGDFRAVLRSVESFDEEVSSSGRNGKTPRIRQIPLQANARVDITVRCPGWAPSQTLPESADAAAPGLPDTVRQNVESLADGGIGLDDEWSGSMEFPLEADAAAYDEDPGFVRLLVVVRDSRIAPVAWGNTSGCRLRVDIPPTDLDVPIEVEGDIAAHLLDGFGRTLRRNRIYVRYRITEYRLPGRVEPGWSSDFRVVGSVTEFLIMTERGESYVAGFSSDNQDQLSIRGKEETWVCQRTTRQCGPLVEQPASE